MGVVARSGLFGIFKRAMIRVAGTAQHQTLGCPSLPIPPVADRAPLRKDLRTFLGGSAVHFPGLDGIDMNGVRCFLRSRVRDAPVFIRLRQRRLNLTSSV